MNEFLARVYWGNSILMYLSCAIFLIISLGVLKVIKNILLLKLENLAQKTKTSFDDFIISLVKQVFVPFMNLAVFYLFFFILNLEPGLRRMLDIAGVAVGTFFVAKLATMFCEYAFNVYSRRVGGGKTFVNSLQGIIRMIKFIIWALAVIFFFDNLGFKVTAVLAGLGIGGVAVALAAQAVLADLFSYFAILFDRPFQVGDFIIIGDYMGVVENVGIKTTRISSLGGEQLIFSNSDLTNSRVRNYKRMSKRRVVFKFGVVYQTSLEVVKEIPGIVENIIKGIENAIFDRAHFFSYGDSSLVYEVVYYVNGGDYNLYMDIQQQINFGIKEAFEAKGIDFAYPTQTLYINKD